MVGVGYYKGFDFHYPLFCKLFLLDTEVIIGDMAIYIEINGKRTDPKDLDEDFEYYLERCTNVIEGLVCSKHGETKSLSVVLHFAEPDINSSSKIEVSGCCEDFEVEVFNKLLR